VNEVNIYGLLIIKQIYLTSIFLPVIVKLKDTVT